VKRVLKKTHKNQTAEAFGINRWKQSDTVASSFGYSLAFWMPLVYCQISKNEWEWWSSCRCEGV